MNIEWAQHAAVRTAKVPGGTIVHVPPHDVECDDGNGRSWTTETYPGGVVFVPDFAVGDRPPMTDAELVAWLTATYGEPDEGAGKVYTWNIRYDVGAVCRLVYASAASDNYRWNSGQSWLAARTAGPALWAAHYFGGTP